MRHVRLAKISVSNNLETAPARLVITQRPGTPQLFEFVFNRNDDGPDSLEAVIRDENQPDCLPVILPRRRNRHPTRPAGRRR